MAGSAPGIAGEVVREILAKCPNIANLTLARILARDHPALFKDVEAARLKIRYHRGSQGVLNRGHVERGSGLISRLDLPAPEAPSFAPVELPASVERWLTIADLHIPYHSNEAIRLAIETGREHKCDGLFILGDLLDCYQLSSYVKDPRRRGFGDELDNVADFLDYAQSRLHPKEIVWRAANHEYRLERYLMLKARELLMLDIGDTVFSLRSWLNLDKRGIKWIGRGNPVRHRRLNFMHGDEWRGFTTPVNPARSVFLRSGECTVVAHCHVTSEHTGVTLRGVTNTCWSLGCLCDLHPEYMPATSWNHGFGILDAKDNWRFHNYRIVNGEVV